MNKFITSILKSIDPVKHEETSHHSLRFSIITFLLISASLSYGFYLNNKTFKTTEINKDENGIPTSLITFEFVIKCKQWNNWDMDITVLFSWSKLNITEAFSSCYFLTYSSKLNQSLMLTNQGTVVSVLSKPENKFCSFGVNIDALNGLKWQIKRVTNDDCIWIPSTINYDQLAYSNNNQPVGIIGWSTNGTINSKLESINDWVGGLLPSNYVNYIPITCFDDVLGNLSLFYADKLRNITYYNEYQSKLSWEDIIIQVLTSLPIQFLIFKTLINFKLFNSVGVVPQINTYKGIDEQCTNI
jgi:hypothetical protein